MGCQESPLEYSSELAHLDHLDYFDHLNHFVDQFGEETKSQWHRRRRQGDSLWQQSLDPTPSSVLGTEKQEEEEEEEEEKERKADKIVAEILAACFGVPAKESANEVSRAKGTDPVHCATASLDPRDAFTERIISEIRSIDFSVSGDASQDETLFLNEASDGSGHEKTTFLVPHEIASEQDQVRPKCQTHTTQPNKQDNGATRLTPSPEEDSNLNRSAPLVQFKFQSLGFDCWECDYTTTTKESLAAHQEHHSFHRCAECAYTTQRASYLKRHQKIHSSAKKFQCLDCAYECRTVYNLKRHAQLHLKHLSCDRCDFSTHSQTALRRHAERHAEAPVLLRLRARHPVQPKVAFQCGGRGCSFGTASKYNFLIHKTTCARITLDHRD